MSRKTGLDIEADIYALVTESALASMTEGGIYRKDTRPLNSEAEDIIVAFVGGVDGQEQEGIVNVNYYVSNIDNGSGKKVPNLARVTEVAQALQSFIEGAVLENYDMWPDTQITAYKVLDTEQHCVNLRIAYKRSSIND